MHILVVEDEPRMAALLRSALTEEGHHATVAGDGETALGMAAASLFDVIVLDVMLPRVDGLTVVRQLREARNQTPLLILTAKDSNADMVRALDIGADDYLVKPFSFAVLLARIRAVGRRGSIPQSVRMQVADLTLDTASRKVFRGNRQINLTPREYSLLELLLRHKGTVVNRRRILAAVWGFESPIEENTLEAFIRLLRNKIDFPGMPRLIHTVRGVGYCLREDAN
jgi:DNA-binding response OmpR family regulator